MAYSHDPWESEDNQPHSPSYRDSRGGPYYRQGESGRHGPHDPLLNIPPGFAHIPHRPGINPFKRMLRQNANAVCVGLILVFAFSFAVSRLLWFLCLLIPDLSMALHSISDVTSGLIDMLLSTLSMLLPALLIAAILNMPLNAALPLRMPRARLAVPGVMCCLGMSVVGVYFSAWLSMFLSNSVGVTPSMPDLAPPYGTAETIVHLISISVIPAVFEELLFRGVIMQSLRRFGDSFALVCSSMLFAMLHRNLIQGPNAMLSGLVLGYFALRSGTVLTSIIMHFFNNFLSAVVTVTMLYMPARQAQVLNFAVLPVYLLLGAIGIILMLTLNGGFMRPRHTPTGLGEGEKYGVFFTAPLALVFILVTLVLTGRYISFS